jgi:hypothetical protein
MAAKKAIFIVGGVVAVLVIGVGVALFLKFRNGPSAAVPPPSSAGGAENQEVPISQAYPQAPRSAMLSLGTASGTIQVNNFYGFGAGVVDGGVIIIKSTSSYWFTYDPLSGSFWIAVAGRPFDGVRAVAEQDFLATLGISQTDACKLDITEGIPYVAGDPLDGRSFSLSFCSVTF